MTDDAVFVSSLFDIEPAWIDYNDHLNMGYYTVLFDRAADEAYAVLGFGPDYLTRTGHTTYTAEFHVCFLRELKLGDRVRSTFHIIDHDEKRFHSFQELHHEDGWLAATGEGLALHVDISGPRVAPIPLQIQTSIAQMAAQTASRPRPDGVGRTIGLHRKK